MTCRQLRVRARMGYDCARLWRPTYSEGLGQAPARSYLFKHPPRATQSDRLVTRSSACCMMFDRRRHKGMSDPSTDKPKLLVGIGASAGGIEAWQALFEAVPADSGIAFILVLHLDPRHGSRIAEILQARTKHVTITQAQGTARLQPNHAYVIAPNSKLHLVDGVLRVDPLAENEARGGLVDYLFSSLAEAEGQRAVGVVLSGAGHDGTEGLRHIKRKMGLSIAQEPATAASAGMPQSAINAGVVDAVLAPGAIPATLVEFAEHGSRPSREEDSEAEGHHVPATGFWSILKQLSVLADVSFDDYKVGTLARRIRRRMNLNGIGEADEYAAHLADHPEELDALYYDVLIDVTEFFRDPPVWDRLAEELVALIEQRDGTSLRAWVAGCGTGEEAYSLAMLLHERLAKNRAKLQIYATDLNERALEFARRGIYAPGVHPERNVVTLQAVFQAARWAAPYRSRHSRLRDFRGSQRCWAMRRFRRWTSSPAATC